MEERNVIDWWDVGLERAAETLAFISISSATEGVPECTKIGGSPLCGCLAELLPRGRQVIHFCVLAALI